MINYFEKTLVFSEHNRYQPTDYKKFNYDFLFAYIKRLCLSMEMLKVNTQTKKLNTSLSYAYSNCKALCFKVKWEKPFIYNLGYSPTPKPAPSFTQNIL